MRVDSTGMRAETALDEGRIQDVAVPGSPTVVDLEDHGIAECARQRWAVKNPLCRS